MKRIVHIIDDLGLGGAQRQLVELLRGFPRTMFQIEVISLSDKKCHYVNNIRELHVPLTLIPQKGAWDHKAYRRLQAKLKELKPDIIHTWLFTADLYGHLAARRAGSPRLISAMRNTVDDFPWHYRMAYRFIAARSHAITINADAIRPGMTRKLGVPTEKMHTIHNGISLSRFPSAQVNGYYREQWKIEKGKTLVAMIARMSPQKDYDLYLDGAARVLKEEKNVCFLLVGDGGLRGALESKAKRLGIQDSVRFTGARRDVWEILNHIDICVLTSHYEGCSNVIMEAMTASRPVIASNVGGNAELIEDGVTGNVLKTRKPAELAEAVKALVRNPELARQMGQAGRERIESLFTLERTVEKTIQLYQELLSGAEMAVHRG